MGQDPARLAHENIGKLLFTFAFPSIIASTACSLYNVIDSIFIGQSLGPLALAALGISLPIMNLATAFGTLVGSGAAALVSIRMGEKKQIEATQILGNALLLNLIISICFTISTLFFLHPILHFFKTSEAVMPYAVEFLRIILIGNIFSQLLFGLNAVMRASGYPTKAMLSVLITVVCNLIFAPIAIFALGWGMSGAAWATVTAQFIGMCWVLAHFLQKKSCIHFQKGEIHFNMKIVFGIFAIGLSPFFIHICTSIVTLIMNGRLGIYGGDDAIASYSLVNRILSLIITAVLGLTHGMQVIVGYNYGANNHERVLKTYWLTVVCAMVICTGGFIVTMVAPHTIVRCFVPSMNNEPMIDIAIQAMQICCCMLPLVGFQVVTSNFFQAIDKAKIAIFLSILRQIIFLIPLVLLLPMVMGLKGVWYAIPFADICSIIVSALIMGHFIRQYKTKQRALSV